MLPVLIQRHADNVWCELHWWGSEGLGGCGWDSKSPMSYRPILRPTSFSQDVYVLQAIHILWKWRWSQDWQETWAPVVQLSVAAVMFFCIEYCTNSLSPSLWRSDAVHCGYVILKKCLNKWLGSAHRNTIFTTFNNFRTAEISTSGIAIVSMLHSYFRRRRTIGILSDSCSSCLDILKWKDILLVPFRVWKCIFGYIQTPHFIYEK